MVRTMVAHSRRDLLSGVTVVGAAVLAHGPALARAAVAKRAGISADTLARDEDFWFAVRQGFSLDGRYAILNGGGSNPPPRAVVEAHQRNIAFISPSPLVNTRRAGQFPEQAIAVRQRLARFVNASIGEVALTRNTTEGMNIAIAGLQLQPGDEILTDPHVYYSVRWALDQRARRDNIIIRTVALPLPARPGADLAAPFANAIGPRTRAIVTNHLVDGIGQIMPIAALSRIARQRGLVLIVDGALSFGQIECNMQALGCDVFATSLHKFLLAPQGTGMLYVRSATIANIWPMYGVEDPASTDITKFETIGTRPYAEIGAIQPTLDLHEAIGMARKAARLQWLKHYWADRFVGHPRINFGASLDPGQSASTLQMGINGIAGRALSRHLIQRHGVLTYGPILSDGIDGVYVAPNIYNGTSDLDRLIVGIEQVLATGIDTTLG